MTTVWPKNSVRLSEKLTRVCDNVGQVTTVRPEKSVRLSEKLRRVPRSPDKNHTLFDIPPCPLYRSFSSCLLHMPVLCIVHSRPVFCICLSPFIFVLCLFKFLFLLFPVSLNYYFVTLSVSSQPPSVSCHVSLLISFLFPLYLYLILRLSLSRGTLNLCLAQSLSTSAISLIQSLC